MWLPIHSVASLPQYKRHIRTAQRAKCNARALAAIVHSVVCVDEMTTRTEETANDETGTG
jgi:hypothetical protein